MFAEIVNPSKTFFKNAYFDGIIGLALPGLAQKGTVPLFDNIMKQKLLGHNIFSFYFDRTHNFSKSFISFGETDKKFYSGDLDYHEIISEKYWQIKLDKILVDGVDTNFCNNNCKAILDTGTALINGPSQDLYGLIKFLNVDEECKNYEKLPNITFIFNGVKYNLEPRDYVLAKKKSNEVEAKNSTDMKQ